MELDATYRITTPLFLGGMDTKETAEIRPPSLKGLLRFWFRAIALPQLGSLESVWTMERELFGSTKNQSSFLLTVADVNVQQVKEPIKGFGISYLGYGVIDTRGNPLRPYLRGGGGFKVHILTGKRFKNEQLALLVQAVKALGLMGGGGARSRKGFGSLSLESLRCNGKEIWKAPASAEELKQSVREFLGEIVRKELPFKWPPYTAFGRDTRVFILKTGHNPIALLNEIGAELIRYRSYGVSGGGDHQLPWKERAEQNFADDHDVIRDYLTGKKINRHPRRVVFGLPHSYFFKSMDQKATVNAEHRGRRASPLFIHIHALDKGEYAAVATLIPASFLPDGERIAIRGGRQRSAYLPCNVDYTVIENFFKRAAFSSRVVVWP